MASLICVDNLLRVSSPSHFLAFSCVSKPWYKAKECVYRGQLHECLHHFVPVRAVHSFCCLDLSLSCALASKVMHSLREISEAIHDFTVEYMLTSIAVLWMAHSVHHNIKVSIRNLQVINLCPSQWWVLVLTFPPEDVALKGGGKTETSSLLLGLLLCDKSLSNHYRACVCQQDTVMGHLGAHLHIIFLINEVAVNSRVVGHFTAMKWSTDYRWRLK